MVDVMLSVHCGTMLSHANNFKAFLIERGYSVFLCDQMSVGANYRDEISLNAAECQAMVPFINEPWCNSKECDYEFKIALRHSLIGHKPVTIMPLLLEDFAFYKKFPTVNGFLCNTNGIPAKADALNEVLWSKLLTSLQSLSIHPTASSSPDKPAGKNTPLSLHVSGDTISVNTAPGNIGPTAPSTTPQASHANPVFPFSPISPASPSFPSSPLPPGYGEMPGQVPGTPYPSPTMPPGAPTYFPGSPPYPHYPHSHLPQNHPGTPPSIPSYPNSPPLPHGHPPHMPHYPPSHLPHSHPYPPPIPSYPSSPSLPHGHPPPMPSYHSSPSLTHSPPIHHYPYSPNSYEPVTSSFGSTSPGTSYSVTNAATSSKHGDSTTHHSMSVVGYAQKM